MDDVEGRFGMFVLEGARFKAPGVPVDALIELVTYRELVVDVAKQCFLRDNPGRERSRRNLDQDFDLRLDGVIQGSSDLLVRRHFADPPTASLINGRDVQTYYDEGRDLVSDAVASVGLGEGLPKAFPRKSVVKFRNFGKTLAAGHRLRLSDPVGARKSYMTPVVHEAFLDIIANTSQPVRQEVAGRIVELDTERGVFNLRTSDGDRIPCSYGFHVTSVAKELLADENGDGPLVSVEGDALVSSAGTIQRFTDVAAIELFGLDALLKKLDEIHALDDGWLNRESLALQHEIYVLAKQAISDLGTVPEGFSPAPLPDGGLRFEWSRGSTEYVLEFEVDGGMYMCLLPSRPAGDQDVTLKSYDATAFQRFVLEGELG